MSQSTLHSCAKQMIKAKSDDFAEDSFLSLQDISVRLGHNDILKSINLEIKRGEFIALLGSSGCGKTTLLRTVAGFNHPNSGKINVAGKDLTSLAPDKRGMALVFQSYALWPHMSVEQNIGYGLRIRGEDKQIRSEKVQKIAELLGLEALLSRMPEELSGGQRQRVALGRALVIEPDILLLDEPLSNLDTRIRLNLRHEISAIQKRLGITALHVTHDREEAMVMADRVVILNKGEIAQIGAPHDVYNHPESDFVAAFMGAENQLQLDIEVSGKDCSIKASSFNMNTQIPLAQLPLGKRQLKSGAVSARFRGEAARLHHLNETTQSNTTNVEMNNSNISPLHSFKFQNDCELQSGLKLQGIIEQVSYPGGIWRYLIKLGDHHVMVDSAQKFTTGNMIGIEIKSNALFLFNI